MFASRILITYFVIVYIISYIYLFGFKTFMMLLSPPLFVGFIVGFSLGEWLTEKEE